MPQDLNVILTAIGVNTAAIKAEDKSIADLQTAQTNNTAANTAAIALLKSLLPDPAQAAQIAGQVDAITATVNGHTARMAAMTAALTASTAAANAITSPQP